MKKTTFLKALTLVGCLIAFVLPAQAQKDEKAIKEVINLFF